MPEPTLDQLRALVRQPEAPGAQSTSRTLKDAHGRGLWKTEKGSNGKNLCRWCRTEVTGRRITFCSDPCVHEWRIRSSTRYAREQVEKRDKGICKECGRDTIALWNRVMMRIRLVRNGTTSDVRQRGLRWARFMARLGYQAPTARFCFAIRSLWEMDHVVEVVRGGGTCGLENYQTLCVPHHRAKTRRLAKERAAERRAAKQPQLSLGER